MRLNIQSWLGLNGFLQPRMPMEFMLIWGLNRYPSRNAGWNGHRRRALRVKMRENEDAGSQKLRALAFGMLSILDEKILNYNISRLFRWKRTVDVHP